MNVLFVCTGNYYRSKFCENLWFFLLEKFDKKGSVSSSGLNPGLAQLWKDAFGRVSPFTRRALKIIGVPLVDDSSLHLISQQEVDDSDIVVFLNKSEHLPMLADSRVMVPISKIVAWNNEDVDQEFPMEAIFSMISNTCELFQETYDCDIKCTERMFKQNFFSKFKIFSEFRLENLKL